MMVELAVPAVMIAAAARAGRLRFLLSSGETMIWLGGICLLIAGLYRVRHYHRATYLSDYGMLTEFATKPSIADLPKLLFAWPMVYGAIAVGTSYLAIKGSTSRAYRWRWLAPAFFLVGVTGAPFVLNRWAVKWDPDSSWLMLFFVPCLALAAMVPALFLVGDSNRKIAWINLIAGLFLAPTVYLLFVAAIYPPYDDDFALAVTEILHILGQGFALLVLGNLLLVVGSITILCTRKGLASTR